MSGYRRAASGEGADRPRYEELAAKLRLTAAALGCTTHKDLCGRFSALNPATEFDLERSYKWMQGRALPRSARVYADWVRVIGTSRTPDWLMHCGIGEFLQELEAIRGVSAEELLRRARLADAGKDREAASGLGADNYVAGTYACYSFAWSSYFSGKLIRGSLVVEPGHGAAAAPTAIYAETLATGRCEMRGPVQLRGRSLFLDLRDAASGLPLFFALYLPAPPASVLTGLMTGATLVGPDPEPSVSRIAVVRVPATPAQLDDSNRYLDADDNALTRDLGELGLSAGTGGEIGATILGFLTAAARQPGFDQVRREETAPLVAALDRLFIDSRTG